MNLDLAATSGAAQPVAAFVAGFLSSLTPCVYPLIPVTLSIFGANGAGPKRGFFLACTYVLGIAITYTALGVLSATSGVVFGAALGNPYVVATICGVLILLSLFTLDVVRFEQVYRMQTKASNLGGRGFLGALIMGLVAGIVAAPCVGPVLIVILGVVSQAKDPLWGGLLMFIYALGFGMLFIVLGTFSSFMQRMPRSGNWLNWIKFVIAAGLLMVALFLLQGFVSLPLNRSDHLIVLCLMALIAFLFASVAYKRDLKFAKIVAATLLAVAVFKLVMPGAHATLTPGEALVWNHGYESSRVAQRSEQRVLMLDLYADWCAACKELDAITFSDPKVQAVLRNFVLGRVDFTTGGEESDAITERYNVLGLPCILFLRPDGTEIPESRISGFLNPEEFLKHIARIKAQ